MALRHSETMIRGDFKSQNPWPTGPWVTTMNGGISRYAYSDRSDIVRTVKDKSTGWRPPTAYFAHFYRKDGPKGTYYEGRVGRTLYEGCLSNFDVISQLYAPSPAGWLRSKAEVQALTRLKDQRVNLAQAFAERNQTAKLFSNNISRVAKLAQAIRRGTVGAVAEELGIKRPRKNRRSPVNKRDFPAAWLENQYGWKPLLQDIHGAIDHLQGIGREAYRITVKGSAQDFWVTKEEFTNPGYFPAKWSTSSETGVRVRLDYIPGNFFVQSLSQAGITNPALLAWELLPYSFVVDWALPIGNWLGTLDAASGYEFLGGSRTSHGLAVRDVSDHKNGPDNKAYSKGIVGRERSRSFTRSVYLSSPIPTLPRFKNPISTGHIANALSLLATAFGRR